MPFILVKFWFYITASPNGMVIKPCISMYKEGLYKMMGEMVATCIVQGGEAPSIFTPSVVEYILTGDITSVDSRVEDIPQMKMRNDLKKVKLNIFPS